MKHKGSPRVLRGEPFLWRLSLGELKLLQATTLIAD